MLHGFTTKSYKDEEKHYWIKYGSIINSVVTAIATTRNVRIKLLNLWWTFSEIEFIHNNFIELELKLMEIVVFFFLINLMEIIQCV